MKKLFLIITIICLTSLSCYADTMQVMSLIDISIKQPDKPVYVIVMKDMKLTKNISLEKGCKVKGYISKVVEAKRLKQNATFYFTPTEYTNSQNEKFIINEEVSGKYSPKFEINVREVAKTGALMVADEIINDISIGYYAVEGAVKNKKGNVLKSSVDNVYKNSAFSYFEKGKNTVEIPANSYFSFHFPLVEVPDIDKIVK